MIHVNVVVFKTGVGVFHCMLCFCQRWQANMFQVQVVDKIIIHAEKEYT